MKMPPTLRKLFLTIHLLTSIGWIGAAAAYVALVSVVLASQEARTVRDAILVMYPIDWFVIVPSAAIAYITGLVLALGTQWGLFKHWWIVFSLLMTSFGLFVLTEYSLTLREMAGVAAQSTISSSELAMLKDPGHAVHSLGGIALLLTVTVLNIFKPRGLTRHGWRKQQEARASRLAPAR